MNIYKRTTHRAQSTDSLTVLLKRLNNKNALPLVFIATVLAATSGFDTASAATATGRLSATPSSANIGNVLVGNEYSQTVRLNNTGTGSITFSHITVTGAGFSTSGLTTPSKVSAGNSISFTVHFAPMTLGAAVGSLVITSDASNSKLTIGLTGTGVMGRLSATPSIANIGTVLVGSEYSTTVRLNNSGTGSITFSHITVTGAGFSTSGLTTPSKVSAGNSISFTVHFAPMTLGAAVGSLVITSDASNSKLTIGLSGTGVAGALSATPSIASFGRVVTGDSDSQTIRLNNTGTIGISISRANISGTGFKIEGLTVPTVIAAGRSATFNAVFAPTSTGSRTGSVSLTSNVSKSPFTISLSGIGVAATSLLGASPTGLNFGTMNVNSDSSLGVTLTNLGNSNVTISRVDISGLGFSQSGATAGITLAPNQSTKLNIAFKLVSAGSAHGNVTVTSSASNSPTTISLSGTAIQHTAKSVDLTWNPSTSSGVAGYNVYRGMVSGGPYTKLTSYALPDTQYTDTLIEAGHTYYYVVTAVNSGGVESSDSTQVSADIPMP